MGAFKPKAKERRHDFPITLRRTDVYKYRAEVLSINISKNQAKHSQDISNDSMDENEAQPDTSINALLSRNSAIAVIAVIISFDT